MCIISRKFFTEVTALTKSKRDVFKFLNALKFLIMINFCHEMLCVAGLCHGAVSVCPSVHLSVTLVYCYAPAPWGGALSGHRRPSSVRLSDVVYIGSNSKTKRPRKTKLCTGVLPQVTCDSHTDIKVKRSKVKVGRGHIVAAT